MKQRKCPKCGGTLFQTDTEWKHTLSTSCKYSSPRFIGKPENSPLLLRLETKGKDTKKFLEDIMQEPEEPKETTKPGRSWYFGGEDMNLVFVRTDGRRLEVYTKEQWAEMLAKEMQER